jgi:hypothetical protein
MPTIKGLLFRLLPQAAETASGRYPVFSQRDIYYRCRDMYLNHPERPYEAEYRLTRQRGETDEQYEQRREAARRTREPIDYKYFTNKILREYEEKHGDIEGMIREAYGTLVEPHSGDSIELGTQEVAEYAFPQHSFNKILVCEKLTEKPKFLHDQIAEKYDMALVFSRGFATEALHELLSEAEGERFQIFLWHDADPSGYNISRNIREATKNMPVAIDIVDIGLTVEEALRIGCASEPFTSDKALPYELRETLSDVELEYFEERQIRFEINGIAPDRRMRYVEEQLQAHGIGPKYVPPEEDLAELVADDFEEAVSVRVGIAIDDLVSADEIVTLVTDLLRDRLQLEDPEDFIRGKFAESPTLQWCAVVDREHRKRLREAREEIEELVREQIVTW